VVDAGALDTGAVALGRAVVHGEQQRPVRSEQGQGAAEQQAGEPVGAAAQGRQEVVVGGEATADVGDAQPAGDGAAPLGKQGTQEQDSQPPGVALVEAGGQAGGEVLPKGWQEGKIQVGSPGWGRGREVTPILARESSSCQKIAIPVPIGDY
jgi:hypothetical protein